MPSGDAARLGEELRDARISSGLSIEDMSAVLRIRRVYLLALEEGRVRDLPSPAYALGFVRNYATSLGLDAEDFVRRFRETIGTVVQKKQDLVFPEPVPERGIPSGAIILVGVLLAAAAYGAWYSWSSGGDRTVDAVPPVPPRLERAAREGTSPEPPPPASSSSVPLPEPVPVPVVVPPPPPPPPPPPSPTDASRITLRFTQPVWTQVRAPGQQAPLLERVMRAGETWTPPNREGLLLTLGSVAGVEVLVDGQQQPGFAPGQGTRRAIPLDPVLFRAGLVQPGARFTTPPAAPSPAASAPAPQQQPATRPAAPTAPRTQ